MLVRSEMGLAIEVHRARGPGLFESVSEECLCFELEEAGVPFQRQVPLPTGKKGINLGTTYRADMLVGGDPIVEIEAVGQLTPLHEEQALTYPRLGGRHVGLLFRFNTALRKDGMRR